MQEPARSYRKMSNSKRSSSSRRTSRSYKIGNKEFKEREKTGAVKHQLKVLPWMKKNVTWAKSRSKAGCFG
jgi:hypothetical protein